MLVQAVLGDGVRVQGLQRVQAQAQGQQQEPVQVLVREQEPKHHHNLWLRWLVSRRRFSSIRQKRFSKLRRRSCANC